MATNKNGANASGKRDLFLYDPKDLVIVEDVASALHDDRAKLPLNEALVLSVMCDGVIEPIIVRKNKDTGDVEVVDGRQRVKAAREANKRLAKKGAEQHRVAAVMRRGEAHELMGVMITANEHREDDTPLGRAKKMARYLDLGRTKEECAIKFGCSVASINNHLSLADAPTKVVKALRAGKIAASDAYKLAKLEPKEAEKRLGRLEKEAPVAEAGKKRKKKGGKRAREILSGGEKEVRSKAEVIGMQTALLQSMYCPGEVRREMDAVLDWVLGNDEALAEWLAPPEKKVNEA